MKFLFLATVASAHRVTPVEKVTELMLKLKQKTIDEAGAEKKMFQKFNDYCHSQEDEKFWRAAKGAKKVDRLDMEIEDHTAQIEKKERQIEELNSEIEMNREDVDGQTKDKISRREEDDASLKDLDTVISQCQRAIKHLRQSDVSGTGFMQLADMLEMTLKLRKPPASLKMFAQELDELHGDPNAGKPHKYKFHSTKVITLLEELLKEFKDQRLQTDKDALSAQRDAEHAISALQNLVDSQVHKRDEFQGEVDQHTQQKQEKMEDRAQTDQNLFADTDFAHHLVGCDQFHQRAVTENKKSLVDYLPRHDQESEDGCPSDIGECGEKRNNYAARVKTRNEEIDALSQAIELLQGKGGKNYGANKRLVATQKEKEVKEHKTALDQESETEDEKIERLWDEDRKLDSRAATNFLQMSSHHQSFHHKLETFLDKMSKQIKSTALASVLMKIKMGDHFKDIRKMIQDMIDRLEKQVAAEQEQKEWCDEQVKVTTEKQEKAEEGIQSASAKIDSETAKSNLLKKEISELQAEIADDQKAKEEAAKNRNAEKEVNETTLQDAREGLKAVEQAIGVLRDFYENNSGNSEEGDWLQLKSKQKKPELINDGEQSQIYRADGEGADGKTISDTRPESGAFGTKYDGNQAESKGIIGTLEIIKSDYERTIDTTETDERKAAEEWEASDKALAEKIKKAETIVDEKTDSKEAADEATHSAQGDLKTETEERELRKSEMTQLKPLCFGTPAADQLEERRKRRQQEVAALRESLEILREFN